MRSADSHAVLRAGGHEVAVAAAALCELLPRPATLTTPADSVLVPGILWLRGEAVPAIPLHSLLGLAGEEVPAGLVAVLRTAEGPLGLAIDGVAEVRHIPAAAWRPAAETPFCDAVHLPACGTRLLRRLVPARLLPGRGWPEQPHAGWSGGPGQPAGLALP